MPHLFFCMWILFSHHQLLKKIVFSPLSGLGTLIKSHLPIYVRVYFWVFYSVTLTYMSVFMPVLPVLITVALYKFSGSVKLSTFIFRDCFGYSGPFIFHMNFRINFFLFLQKTLLGIH